MSRLFLLTLTFVVVFGGNTASADENLKTPYILLDPAALPPPATVGEPIPIELSDPTRTPPPSSDFGVPRISATEAAGVTRITLSNAAISFRVRIDADLHASIESLRDELANTELLASASAAFSVSGKEQRQVTRWKTLAYPDHVELRVEFDKVTWRARLLRDRPHLEQEFEHAPADAIVAQVLNVLPSLKPVMPANAFGQGFSNGVPNLKGRHRFEIVGESDHASYNPDAKIGLWGFVADIGGQERIAPGQFGLVQHPSFRTRANLRTGIFVIQPFRGSIERGFADLRSYIQRHYSIQGQSPALYEWNQFWLWQGGPSLVDRRVVTWQRLMEVLPRQISMGLEEFHLDAGWERQAQVWEIATDRFPGGWNAVKSFNRAHGLAFHLWVNDGASDSSDFILDLIDKTGLSRLFMDRQVTEKTAQAVNRVRELYPGFSTSCHNSTSRSRYWSWGDPHFLRDFNQIYFGEGQFWAWSNILPEAQIEPKVDPLYPQRTEAERFFSRHDMYVGNLVTRCAAYQAQWVWPFNCTSPPHCGWAWFEKRPIEELRDRIYSYLACKFNYQWGFDPSMLPREAVELHLDCTAWFKVNRMLLTEYQHVLGPPDGKHIDAAGHVRNGRGFVFLFNPSDKTQEVKSKQILWEPELELERVGPVVSLSDWTSLRDFTKLESQDLSRPTGTISVPPRGVRVIGVNLDDAEMLRRVRDERARIGL